MLCVFLVHAFNGGLKGLRHTVKARARARYRRGGKDRRYLHDATNNNKKMSIDPKFVELTADSLKYFVKNILD